MAKMMTAEEAASMIHDNDVVMLGGFGKWGYALDILEALYKSTDADKLTFIMNSANQQIHVYLEKLLETRCKQVLCSFMRNSAALQALYYQGKVRLVPQGTLAESIRLAGVGIPAYYNPVGIGTQLAEGRELRRFNGREYLLEETISGQVALFRATKVDRYGNCFLRGATKNFSPLMALACKKVIVEALDYVTEPLEPEWITVPGILVDGIVKVGKDNG